MLFQAQKLQQLFIFQLNRMASNREESNPPPRKSRRLASRTRESVHIQTPLAGIAQNSVQSQFNELLMAAIPTITQSVITALQQSGIVSNTIQSQTQSGDTVQSLTTMQNDTQTAAQPPIPTSIIRQEQP